VDNLFSEKQQRLLTEPLYSSWLHTDAGEKRSFLAASNVGLFPSVHEPPLVPDAFLSLGVEAPDEWWRPEHRSYFFWEFGKAPEVVVEVVSNRKGNELNSKFYDYARIGVSYYVVFDQARQLSDHMLQIFRLEVREYRPHNQTSLPGVGLGLTLWDGFFEGRQTTWLRWCDEAGIVIPTGAENTARQMEIANREAERASHEGERANREAERAERLAAKLRELGVDPENV
jgi:Uma2 family endonuclease